MDQIEDSVAHLITAPHENKRRHPPPRQDSQLQRSLVQLVLRHESQLQAQAMEDQLILFLQADQVGILHHLVQETSRWKEMIEKKATSTPLRQHLFQTLTQELMTRLEQLSKAKPTDPLWQKALDQHMITTEGHWQYLQYDPQQKKMIPTSKKPIAMTQMI